MNVDFDSLDRDSLVLLVGEEIADAIIERRQQTDEEPRKLDEEEYSDDEFTKILEDRAAYSRLSETEKEAVKRWSEIEALRDHYVLFEDFLYDCMTELMGFKCTDIQIDIGRFLQFGEYDSAEEMDAVINKMLEPTKHGMIQAQRSQAKSTIVAMFAVWQLIHDCKHRVLILSAGSDVAMEIANWVIQIIMNWDILECMRPDRQHGDRASSKAFDVHWMLKGAEKSPSVACIGVTANMQGRRADLLIPDDIESSKNGITEVQRAALEHLSKDFTSICKSGRIIYLGTPQTVDSIYNNLPARGYVIRVWPGRYPTEEQEEHYATTLAPLIRKRMEADPSLRSGGGLDGTMGKPTDPVLLDEETLTKKELDQGQAYFQLQHMLNTKLSDEMRHPLKPKNLIVMNFGLDKAPGELTWMPDKANMIPAPSYQCKPELYRPFSMASELYDFEGKYMYVDTAGGGKNGDETVAAVTYFLHGYVFLAEILALPGGYNNENYEKLSQLALKHNVNSIDVEKNFGFGAFAAAWRPIIAKVYREANKTMCPRIEDVWESGQKEKRIIDTLEPIMSRHRLIVHQDVIDYDIHSVGRYPLEKRESYKFIHQLAKMSYELNALLHDDRVDAVAGAVRRWVDMIAVDEQIRMDQKVTDENVAFFAEWGGDIGAQNGVLGLASDRFKRPQNRRRRKR